MVDPTYNYKEFWRDLPSDSTHLPPLSTRESKPEHLRQEAKLIEVLNELAAVRQHTDQDLDWPRSILEVGSGLGRLAQLFAYWSPMSTYEAIDLNPANVKATLDVRPDATVEVADITTYPARERYDDPRFEGFDLVIASEVLMHLPDGPPDNLLEAAITRLLTLTNADVGYTVTIDWVPTPTQLALLKRRKAGIAAWNFPHDYELAFRPMANYVRRYRTDQQMIYIWRP